MVKLVASGQMALKKRRRLRMKDKDLRLRRLAWLLPRELAEQIL